MGPFLTPPGRPGSARRGSKRAPQRIQDGPRSGPRGPRVSSRAQHLVTNKCPLGAPVGLSWSPPWVPLGGPPRAVPGRPGSARLGSTRAPRRFQDGPRAPQGGSTRAQQPFTRARRGPRKASKEPRGMHLLRALKARPRRSLLGPTCVDKWPGVVPPWWSQVICGHRSVLVVVTGLVPGPCRHYPVYVDKGRPLGVTSGVVTSIGLMTTGVVTSTWLMTTILVLGGASGVVTSIGLMTTKRALSYWGGGSGWAQHS